MADKTPDEFYQQGRDELFAQIAQADGFNVDTHEFVKDATEEESRPRWYPWHGLASIVFVDGTPQTTNWHNMDIEARERLSGRIDALVEFVLAAHDLPVPPLSTRLGLAPLPVRLEQVLPSQFATQETEIATNG